MFYPFLKNHKKRRKVENHKKNVFAVLIEIGFVEFDLNVFISWVFVTLFFIVRSVVQVMDGM